MVTGRNISTTEKSPSVIITVRTGVVPSAAQTEPMLCLQRDGSNHLYSCGRQIDGFSQQAFFSSGEQLGDTNACCETINLPTAAVQVVAPIALEARIGSVCAADGTTPVRTVIMTLGLFSVVEIFRPVTILVPTYEYTIPTKECHTDTESPCAVFDKIRFPAEEFSPGTLDAIPKEETCGCGEPTECGEYAYIGIKRNNGRLIVVRFLFH